MKTIIQGCGNADFSRAEEEDFSDEYGTTKAYKVQGEDECLYYWNSSNSQEPQHAEALRYISEELENDSFEGSISDGWNEIMFEVK